MQGNAPEPPDRDRALLDFAVSHSPVIFYLVELSREQPVRFISSNVLEITGHPCRRFLEDPGFGRRQIHPDDVAEYERIIGALPRTQSFTHAYRFRSADGEYRWYRDELRLVASRNPSTPEESMEFVGCMVDVTDRVRREQAEMALRESESLTRRVLESCPVPVQMTRAGDGLILYQSPASRSLFGDSSRDGVRYTQDYYVDANGRAEFVSRIRDEGAVDDFEVELKRRDGSVFWGSISGRLIDYRGEEVVVSAQRDLTESRLVAEEMERQREALHQSEKLSALGELLASVAHELNNPLSVVVGQALLLKETTSEPQIEKRAAKIGNAADRCARIVRTFLAMARQRPAASRAASLNEIVMDSLSVLGYSLRSGAVRVSLKLGEGLPLIWGDRDQLNQVVTNLILNAQQAMEEMGGPRRLKITSSYRKRANRVVLKVKDNGPGVPLEIRSRIFEPFFTTKEVGEGTGIGLAFCHRIIDAHGGTINLERTAGRGATFAIRLPVTVAVRNDVVDAGDRGAATSVLSALVVDDEEDVAEMLADILRGDGHRVETAASGRAALKKIRQREFDVILCDVRMPDLDGPGLYRELERRNPEVLSRIAFITGDTLSARVKSFLDGAGRPHIEKPITPNDVRGLVGEVTSNAGREGRG